VAQDGGLDVHGFVLYGRLPGRPSFQPMMIGNQRDVVLFYRLSSQFAGGMIGQC
jgi:hypothetical protein